MSLSNPIGGYFELELPVGDFLHDDAVLLNSGRACFEYVLRATKATHVYMPKYTCDVMLEPLVRQGVSYTFYGINEELEVTSLPELNEGEYILYTNYFGIKDAYSKHLSQKYKGQLILDCSQALYFEPLTEGYTFYSPRKFFGLPDGGMLYTDISLQDDLPIDASYDRFTHLLKRIDLGAEAAYEDFKVEDRSLSDLPLSHMSQVTQRLLGSIDFEGSAEKRLQNFRILHENLQGSNKLSVDISSASVPLCYPYVGNDPTLRKRLIDNKVFVATYWPNVFEWSNPEEQDHILAENILPLPIDQRYGKDEMTRILEIIHE